MTALTVPRTAATAAILALLVYVRTLAPSVSFIDSGELAAVAVTFGIAHPTGYPLFTLLGRCWTMLPFPGEEILRLNLLAAVFAAAGVYVFVHLAGLVLSWIGRESDGRVRELHGVIAGAGGLLLAFSETYWSVAVSIEVYALHVVFLSLILYSFFRAVRGSAVRWWHLFAFVLGLSFCNHLTTILLAPGLLTAYVLTQGFRRESWARLLRMVLPFTLGLSVYLSLPLRAMQGPVLNWGNPVSLERLLWHVSGKQYRVWIFSSTEAAGRQFAYFLSTLPGELTVVGLVLGILGLVVLAARDRRLALVTVLLFAGTVAYSINYDIHDIDSYFLLAYLTLALWAVVGLAAVVRWCLSALRLPMLAAGAVAVLAAVVPLPVHYGRMDESGNRLVEEYTKNLFSSVEQDALVLSYQWDHWISASYYYRHVRGMRRDVAVVDKELLRRSWYFVQLEREYPWLMAGSSAEVSAFLAELEKFEHDRPYDPAVIQGRFVAMIRSFLVRSMATRPVYVTGEIEQEFTGALRRVPVGLVYRLYADTLFHPSPRPQFTYTPFPRRGRLEDLTRVLYAGAWTARAAYHLEHGDVAEAEFSLNSALLIEPGFPEARRIKAFLPR